LSFISFRPRKESGNERSYPQPTAIHVIFYQK
jgi:hypothetical protein